MLLITCFADYFLSEFLLASLGFDPLALNGLFDCLGLLKHVTVVGLNLLLIELLLRAERINLAQPLIVEVGDADAEIFLRLGLLLLQKPLIR